MSPLAGGRLAVLAWSWRRPIAFCVFVVLAVPFLASAALVTLLLSPDGTRSGSLVPPVRGAVLSQPFGCTAYAFEPWSDACPTRHFHSGIDLAAASKTPVRSATDGFALVRRERGGYGLHVVIVRDGELATLYGHLDYPLVGAGERVQAGQVIGLMGSTGNSTGPHLHFEVRVRGLPLDPLPLLPPAAGWR